MRAISSMLLAAGVSLLAVQAQAQTVPTKPGLWAQAHQTLLNGQKLPGRLDVKGAMPPAQRQAIERAMQTLGLPAGWSPAMHCQAGSQLDIASSLKDAKAQGCDVKLTDQSGDRVRFAMSCRTPDGNTAKGEGEYTGVGSAEVRGRYTMTSQYQGQPLKMDSQSVSKWLGSDCSKPPAGIDPSWLSQ